MKAGITPEQLQGLKLTPSQKERLIRQVFGSDEFINGTTRYCIWVEDDSLHEALSIEPIAAQSGSVRRAGGGDDRQHELKPLVAVQRVRRPPGKGRAGQPEASLARER